MTTVSSLPAQVDYKFYEGDPYHVRILFKEGSSSPNLSASTFTLTANPNVLSVDTIDAASGIIYLTIAKDATRGLGGEIIVFDIYEDLHYDRTVIKGKIIVAPRITD